MRGVLRRNFIPTDAACAPVHVSTVISSPRVEELEILPSDMKPSTLPDRFCIDLFSDLEQTHYAHVVLNERL